MKKLISSISLFVYIFFSQFVIKAVATTNHKVADSWVNFCINEQLDTLEGKRNCREKSNSWIFASVAVSNNTSTVLYLSRRLGFSYSEFSSNASHAKQYHSHDPPDKEDQIWEII